MVFVNCYAIDTSIKQGLGRHSRHFPSIQGIGIRCEAVQDGDNHSSPTVDLIDNANSSLAEDSHGNDEAIDHEEDTLFTQMLVDYIEEIYN